MLEHRAFIQSRAAAPSHEPKFALSPVTIPQCSFEEAFERTSEAGFTGIGLRYDKFQGYLQRGGSVAGAKDLLRRFGLTFAEAAFVAEWQFFGGVPLVSRRQRSGGPEEAPELLLEQAHSFFQVCEQLECENVTAVPALRETGNPEVAAEDFGRLCDLARPYGLRLCLEFMGSAPQYRDLHSANRLVAQANRDNGGIVLDTFLFHQGGSSLADLDTVPIERVHNVQLADAKPKPTEQLNMLEDRLYPGEGVAPVQQIVNVLAARGYNGWWTVELFNLDYAAADPRAVAARAFSSAKSIVITAAIKKAGHEF
jgi:sugar phosphate isomerase/epimerase